MRVRLPPAPPARRGADQGSIAKTRVVAGSSPAGSTYGPVAQWSERLKRLWSPHPRHYFRSTELPRRRQDLHRTRRREFDSRPLPSSWQRSSKGRTPGKKDSVIHPSSVSFFDSSRGVDRASIAHRPNVPEERVRFPTGPRWSRGVRGFVPPSSAVFTSTFPHQILRGADQSYIAHNGEVVGSIPTGSILWTRSSVVEH